MYIKSMYVYIYMYVYNFIWSQYVTNKHHYHVFVWCENIDFSPSSKGQGGGREGPGLTICLGEVRPGSSNLHSVGGRSKGLNVFLGGRGFFSLSQYVRTWQRNVSTFCKLGNPSGFHHFWRRKHNPESENQCGWTPTVCFCVIIFQLLY